MTKVVRFTAVGIVASAMFALATPSHAFEWIFEIMPGALHANFASDEFNVTGPNGKETTSIMSAVPNMNGGLAFDYGPGYIDVKAGGGMLLNAKLGSYFAYGSVGLFNEVRPSVYIGPHISLAYFVNPEWWGDTDIDFKNELGWLVGLHVATGERIIYMLSADYMSVAFDVDRMGPGVTASDDTLDLSGIAVQFGIRSQF